MREIKTFTDWLVANVDHAIIQQAIDPANLTPGQRCALYTVARATLCHPSNIRGSHATELIRRGFIVVVGEGYDQGYKITPEGDTALRSPR